LLVTFRPHRDGQNTLLPFPHPPPGARSGLDALAAADPDLGRIEAAAGPLPWRRRAGGFPGLLQAIVGQQISFQAASAIWRRLHATAGALRPEGLLALPDESLRLAGLSRPKIVHARALAAAFAEGRLSEAALAGMGDTEAVAAIAAVRGMGIWTAEIYLLFALERPDVFPAGDLALAAAATHLKALPSRPGPAALRRLAEPWQPWRALAARLLWHHWRHVTGRPAIDDMPPA
jgi:DNA-3-methyladenine glycosylase II